MYVYKTSTLMVTKSSSRTQYYCETCRLLYETYRKSPKLSYEIHVKYMRKSNIFALLCESYLNNEM